MFVCFQQITVRLGNLINLKALFPETLQSEREDPADMQEVICCRLICL